MREICLLSCFHNSLRFIYFKIQKKTGKNFGKDVASLFLRECVIHTRVKSRNLLTH